MSDYNVRLIIKKEGLELLQKDDSLKDIINKADINKTFANIVYLGWKQLNSEKYFLLQHRTFDVGYNDISYRLTGFGEELTDVQEDYYTSNKEGDLNIPFPSIIRDFDEKDMEQQLNGYLMYEKYKKEKDSIEYE